MRLKVRIRRHERHELDHSEVQAQMERERAVFSARPEQRCFHEAANALEHGPGRVGVGTAGIGAYEPGAGNAAFAVKRARIDQKFRRASAAQVS
jgi:hypothetical protein